MDMLKEFQKMLEDGAKKVSDFMDQISKGNPIAEKMNGFYKEMVSQSKGMLDKVMKNDFSSKIMKDMESYKDDIMKKFTELTKNFGDVSAIQKQFESFMKDGNKKFMDLTQKTFKESYDKFNKELQETLKKFDFTKFFETKKPSPAATKKA